MKITSFLGNFLWFLGGSDTFFILKTSCWKSYKCPAFWFWKFVRHSDVLSFDNILLIFRILKIFYMCIKVSHTCFFINFHVRMNQFWKFLIRFLSKLYKIFVIFFNENHLNSILTKFWISRYFYIIWNTFYVISNSLHYSSNFSVIFFFLKTIIGTSYRITTISTNRMLAFENHSL